MGSNYYAGSCRSSTAVRFAIVIALLIVSGARSSSAASNGYYLPQGNAAKVVTVTERGNPQAEIVVMTRAVATKESGPAATVSKFGEVYEFSPSFIAIRRDVPTAIVFWNLQADDEHDVMLVAPDSSVLMHLRLAPLSKTSYVFTFHRTGLFDIRCAMHQPEMNGQIEVDDAPK